MRIALVDDEPMELDILLHLLKKNLSGNQYTEHIIDTFYNGSDFLSAFQAGKYNIILLDIYMKDISGVDIARKIRMTDNNVQLAFCTNSNSFASESYEVNAQYYLLKPFSEKNIQNMLSRIIPVTGNNQTSVILPDGQEILLRNIIFTEYSNHIVTLHNKKGIDTKTRITHSMMEEILCSYPYFCCCSKGIIANFYEVTIHDKDVFHMSNGCQIPISRRKSKDVQKAYIKFCFEQMRKEINSATDVAQ